MSKVAKQTEVWGPEPERIGVNHANVPSLFKYLQIILNNYT
jgi:hypothetical protein